ncbi:MAG: hypothetical protein PHO37_15040 [Kiritimatiellae bacterium]|nr:hypothetical protein [Kiritimatiellia bacterium]
MSNYIHLNLIHDEELRTSSSVRMHTIIPIFAGLITVGLFIWWLYLYLNYISLKQIRDQHTVIAEQLQPGYKQVLKLSAQEKELTALNAQIAAFDGSRLAYAAALSHIPELVDPSIQFIMIEVTPPSPPLFKKESPASAPTNTFVTTELIITGRAVSTKVDAVDGLLKGLSTGPCTNLIKSAAIPKGSLRQEAKARDSAGEFVLFEIKCPCWPRRFR